MKLYIPILGEQLRLTADWTFDLYNEDRNSSLMEHVGDTRHPGWDAYSKTNPITAIPCTLPAGSVLKADRIFIRKGSEDFNSVTFFLVGARTNSRIETCNATSLMDGVPKKFQYEVKKPARPVRFWVKLADANNIEFESVNG